MTGYALPAPRIGDEGLPLILVGVLVSAAAVGALVWWGSKKKQEEQSQAQASTR